MSQVDFVFFLCYSGTAKYYTILAVKPRNFISWFYKYLLFIIFSLEWQSSNCQKCLFHYYFAVKTFLQFHIQYLFCNSAIFAGEVVVLLMLLKLHINTSF